MRLSLYNETLPTILKGSKRLYNFMFPRIYYRISVFNSDFPKFGLNRKNLKFQRLTPYAAGQVRFLVNFGGNEVPFWGRVKKMWQGEKDMWQGEKIAGRVKKIRRG